MITEKHKLYRKIATRFLKETGLYPYWRSYIKSGQLDGYLRFYQSEKWYTKDKIESIFGETNFTCYLNREKNINFEHTIYCYFCRYIHSYYPELEQKYPTIIKKKTSLKASLIELISTFPQLEKEI